MESTTKILKLKDSNNYNIWQIYIYSLLIQKDFVEAIKQDLSSSEAEGLPKLSPPKPSKKDKDNQILNRKALALILLNLAEGPLLQVKHHRSAFQV